LTPSKNKLSVMTDTVIEVDHLSKQYRLGVISARRLTDDVKRWGAKLRGLPDPLAKLGHEIHTNGNGNHGDVLWALKDISLEVKQGEVLGIIGRNGAGKSTLLKILSRVTAPTMGEVRVKGRIASLLEVGTGFHPELTGRENIFLNGAILGMTKAEIKRQFDQIVEFSGVPQFIDTPVKRYSSGMYVRLAFAVAAHLQPEILIVDEVLAVGDAEFQKKCLGKMRDVAGQGRTVLFVSHNLGAIKELCNKCVVLRDGQMDFQGPATQGLMHYTQGYLQNGNGGVVRGQGWSGVRIRNHRNGLPEPISNAEPIEIEAELSLPVDLEWGQFFLLAYDTNGNGLIHNFASFRDVGVVRLEAGKYRITAEVPPLWLMPNLYMLQLKMIGGTALGMEEKYFSERVVLDITDLTKQSSGKVRATLIPPVNWSVVPQPS
jgi:ABC-type polysaccharide/polyol phosphate transport system ATPase subunit